NHASIIDGIRLCKAKRFRYRHSDMAELEKALQEARGSRLRLIATDGVFSMDGDMARLPDICALADRYDAAVMVDDSHATGLLGNARRLRRALEGAGFTLRPGQHPILPVMLGDAALAGKMADRLLERGIYVIGFSYPVVPQGQARIRIQLSAAHTPEQLDRAAKGFAEVGKELGVT